MFFFAKWIFALVFLGLAGTLAFSQEKTDTNLEGIYLVKGQMAGDKPGGHYIGTAIIRKHKDTYRIEWRIGQSKFLGAGLREGKQLAATWATVREGRLAAGTLLYQVEQGQEGPRLVGRWTGLLGDGSVHRETLLFAEPIQPAKQKAKQKPKSKI